MNSSIRDKRGFTLIELMLVIILISASYFFVFSTNAFKIEKKKNSFSLKNLKEFLIKNYEFEDKLEFVCIDENFDCYIKIDGEIDEKNIVKNVFKTQPEVYEYNKEEIRIDFERERINDVDYDVVFKLTINSNYKNKELILDTLENRLYVFNAVYNEAFIFNSMSQFIESLEEKQLEVKDAF